MRKFLWILIALLATPTLAQGEQWSMLLYNGNTGEMVRVYQDGTQQPYSLNLPEATYISSQRMSFSADGNRVVYCAVNYLQSNGDHPVKPTIKLVVRNLAAGTNLLERDLGTAIDCSTGRDAFNDDETQVTVALSNYFPQDPDADLTKPAWQILVLDVASGNLIQELNSSSQSALDAGLMMEGAMLPGLQVFQNNQIVFSAVPFGTDGISQFVAYRWDLGTNTLTIEPEGIYNFVGGDVLAATGETTWTAANPNLLAAEPAGPVGSNNVVMVAAAGGEPYMVYHSPDCTLIAAKFINDGTQIAVFHYPAYDPNQEIGTQSTKWVAIDRAGNAVDLQTDIVEYSDIVAAPGGYAFVRTSYPDPANAAQVRYSLELHQGGQMTELWSAAMGVWEVAWSAATPVAHGLTPFAALPQ